MNPQLKPNAQYSIRRSTTLASSLLLVGLSLIAACTDSGNFQKLPFVLPFDTQTAGFKVDTVVKVTEYNAYEFGFKLGFREGDDVDRQRVLKLAGDPRRDKAGKLIGPGVPIPLRIRLVATNPSDLESTFEKEFFEHQRTGASDSDVYLSITTIRLKPGTYRIAVENLKPIPEMKGTTTNVFVAKRPKSGPIPE